MMSNLAIRVQGLGKQYRIGGQRKRYKTIRESITQSIGAPFRRIANRQPASTSSFWALKDVSFDIRRGEVIGIIGRNGAGKSTLLKILSRITEPTEGEIEITGRVGSLLEVGTGFHPELTGRENIFLNGAILGMKRNEIATKFDEIVAFAETEKFLDTPVKYYSSGMYTRLAFAVAAHLEPEVLIVDEVLAVGDAAFQKKCLGKIGQVARQGRTVLFVSHNMSVVKSLCETACWLEAGAVKRRGKASSVVDEYLRTSAHDLAPMMDLKDSPRGAGLGTSVRILSLEWLSGLPLSHEGDLEVLIRAAATRDAEGVSAGIGFSTLEGVRLLTLETDMYGPRISLRKGASVEARLRIPDLPLPPGSYSIDVGMRSGDMHGLDYLSGIGRIEVIPGPRTPGNLDMPGAGVRLPSEWIWQLDKEEAVVA